LTPVGDALAVADSVAVGLAATGAVDEVGVEAACAAVCMLVAVVGVALVDGLGAIAAGAIVGVAPVATVGFAGTSGGFGELTVRVGMALTVAPGAVGVAASCKDGALVGVGGPRLPGAHPTASTGTRKASTATAADRAIPWRLMASSDKRIS
jgi:hypothetical protein